MQLMIQMLLYSDGSLITTGKYAPTMLLHHPLWEEFEYTKFDKAFKDACYHSDTHFDSRAECSRITNATGSAMYTSPYGGRSL